MHISTNIHMHMCIHTYMHRQHILRCTYMQLGMCTHTTHGTSTLARLCPDIVFPFRTDFLGYDYPAQCSKMYKLKK